LGSIQCASVQLLALLQFCGLFQLRRKDCALHKSKVARRKEDVCISPFPGEASLGALRRSFGRDRSGSQKRRSRRDRNR